MKDPAFVKILSMECVDLAIDMGRPDGTVIKDLPKYRRMMPYFMKTKAESVIFYEFLVDAENGLEFAERMSKELNENVTFFNLVVHALFKVYVAYPGINRFVKAGKVYDRNGIWFTMTVKKPGGKEGYVSLVKKELEPGFTFADSVRAAKKEIKKARSKSPDAGEKEAKSYLKFPHFLIRLGFPFYKFMEEHGLFSRSYMEKEVFFCSAILTNLGAFGGHANFHHLYEIGTCPVFLTLGKIEERPVVRDGKIVIRKIAPIRVTVDERGEDGFIFYRGLVLFVDQLENPEKLLEPAERIE